MSFQKNRIALTSEEWISGRVIAALWRAFPEATSEAELSEMASPYFRNLAGPKVGQPIDPRTIRYWLKGDTLPRTQHFAVLAGMVGADFFSIPQKGNRA